MKLDYKTERLIEKHAKRCNITKAEALEIYSAYFTNIKEKITSSSYEDGFVEIYMPKLGELRPNYPKIEKVHEVIEARKQQPL
jgi:hypothetical protein